MPDPIKMDGKYACRIAPYEPVRVICVDGPGDCPVAFYAADGNLNGADRYGVGYDANYDLIPLRRKPVEVYLVEEEENVRWYFSRKNDAAEWQSKRPGARLVRLVEAEAGA